MSQLKLTVNEEKTRICKVPEGEFHFLGFTFGRMYSRTTGQARLALRPSKKSIKRMVEKVHALTVRSRTWQETTAMISELNRALAGWANYSVSALQPEPIARLIATQWCGCVGGCVSSTRPDEVRAAAIHSRTSTRPSGSCV